MEHEIHQSKPPGIIDELDAVEGFMLLELLLPFLQLGEVIGLRLDVTIGGDKKTGGSGSGILYPFVRLGLGQCHHTVNEGAWCKILSRARLLLRRVLFEET